MCLGYWISFVRFYDHWILCANLLLWVTFLGCLGGLHCGIPDLKWDTVIVGYHHVNILLWVSYVGYLISDVGYCEPWIVGVNLLLWGSPVKYLVSCGIIWVDPPVSGDDTVISE